MNIATGVVLITGAAGGIGRALAAELVKRKVAGLALVDQSESVQLLALAMNELAGAEVAFGFSGDVTDVVFRRHVYAAMVEKRGRVNICVPAAGITRDQLSVKVDKETGQVVTYPLEDFRQVTEINLVAPVYWALEMVAGIAEQRAGKGLKRWGPAEPMQGVVIFIGSVSARGNKGQLAYAATKAALAGAASTLNIEAIYHGVRCAVVHPGFTDTPMVQAMDEKIIQKGVIPQTQLRRLIRPEEIADAICFLISNDTVSRSLWADAGWRPGG